MPNLLAVLVLVLSTGVLALLLPFASHRTYLLWLAHRRRAPRSGRWRGLLPPVTIQLPVFNERAVVDRLIDAACAVDYPPERLTVQVLDDSTDSTVDRAAARIALWQSRGVRVEHLRRRDRSGFKAGALAEGLRSTDSEFVLVLDADFVAPPTLVRDLLQPFADQGVGMVQARWDHLNAEENGLTRAQALLLDGHFFFEQGGRYAAGRFFNFNGTAGMWRTRCLQEAGGWQSDTLTEDLDVSYRAQMAGWRFVFLEDVGVPAEVPATVAALEVQQRRWSQGGIQTARKLLPELLRGPWPWPTKLEAVIHLCGHLAHPLTLALGLLLFPASVARRTLGFESLWWVDLVVVALATVPFMIFYARAGRKRGTPWGRLAARVPGVLSLGIGLSAPVSRAVFRGLRGRRDPFIRTPKRGQGGRDWYRAGDRTTDRRLESALALMAVASLVAAAVGGYWASMPFIGLFASGYVRLALGGPRVGSEPILEGIQGEDEPHRKPDQRTEPAGLRPAAGLVIGG